MAWQYRTLMLAALTLGAPDAGALAQDAAAVPDGPTLAARAARRFPQPVRVGDLLGRQVLDHTEAQSVLGRVEAVTRRGDGGLDLVLRYGGVLGFGTRPIAVPVDALALLGQYVVAVDVTPAQLAAWPTQTTSGAALPPDERIRVGLVRPAH